MDRTVEILAIVAAVAVTVIAVIYVNDHVFCSSLGGLIKGGCIIR